MTSSTSFVSNLLKRPDRCIPFRTVLFGKSNRCHAIPLNLQGYEPVHFPKKRRLITACLSGLLFTVSATSHALPLGQVEGQTTLQSNTGNGVQRVCGRFGGGANVQNPTQQTLFDVCRSMVQNANELNNTGGPTTDSRNLDATSLNSGIQNISTEEIALTGQTTARTSNAQVVTSMARIQELLGGGGGFRVAALDEVKGETVFAYTPGGDSDYGVRGGAAGSDDPSRFGGFINIIGSFGDKDETSREAGFDFDTIGVQAGLDYRLTDSFVFGGAFGYSHLNSDFKQSVNVDGGGVDADSYGFSLFGLYYLENFYFHGLAGYARNEYDVKRKVFIDSNNPNVPVVDATGKSSPDANTYLISGGGGYDFTYDAWTLGPIVRADYIHSDIGSYNESGAGALNLRVQSQTIKSLTTHVGAQTSYSQSTKFGILSPYLRATWVHEFENDGRFIRSFYINEFVPAGESATILPVESEDPDRDYGRLSLGLSGVFPHGLQGFLQYERWVGLDDINDNVFTLGFRGEF